MCQFKVFRFQSQNTRFVVICKVRVYFSHKSGRLDVGGSNFHSITLLQIQYICSLWGFPMLLKLVASTLNTGFYSRRKGEQWNDGHPCPH